MNQHTDDCILDGQQEGECHPGEGSWPQPAGWQVVEAEGQLGDGAFWCQIRETAYAISE